MTRARKIRITAYLLILIVIIAAVFSVCTVSKQYVKTVNGVSMSSNSTDEINVRWNRVKGADGYYLYNLVDTQENVLELARLEGEESCSYTFRELPGATVYNLRVKAYRVVFGKEYVSKKAQEVFVYTIPDPIMINAFSGSEGLFSVEWNEQEAVSGFEIQYSDDENFKKYESRTVEDGDARNISFENLDKDTTYHTRARSYISVDKKPVYSEWSNVANIKPDGGNLIGGGKTDPDKPMVALSFDDGPAYDYEGSNSTERILDVLEENNARATFFMVAERIDSDTKRLLEREIGIGCELGNHTYSHTHYGSDVTAADIKKASSKIEEYSGQAPTIFRCPGGNITKEIREECKKEGMPIAYWSVDTLDWKNKNSKKIIKEATSHVYDGAIILMHDIYPTTADAVEKLVPQLIKKGYQVVTVSEMLSIKNGKNPEPGQQYVDYKTINNSTK